MLIFYMIIWKKILIYSYLKQIIYATYKSLTNLRLNFITQVKNYFYFTCINSLTLFNVEICIISSRLLDYPKSSSWLIHLHSFSHQIIRLLQFRLSRMICTTGKPRLNEMPYTSQKGNGLSWIIHHQHPFRFAYGSTERRLQKIKTEKVNRLGMLLSCGWRGNGS